MFTNYDDMYIFKIENVVKYDKGRPGRIYI